MRVPRLIHKHADALWPVELVCRQREQIHAERTHVDRNLRRRLHGVGVHERAMLVRDRGNGGDRLNRADFVVGVHHGYDRCFSRDRLSHTIR